MISSTAGIGVVIWHLANIPPELELLRELATRVCIPAIRTRTLALPLVELAAIGRS